MLFREKAEEEKRQKDFKEELTKAMRTKDEGSRKQEVFSTISTYLNAQGLDIDIAKLESYATGAQQLSDSQKALVTSFSKSTSAQLRKETEDKYGKLEEYNALKVDYDTAIDEANKHLVDEYKKLDEKKNRLIKDFGKNTDISDLVKQQAEIAREGMELQSNGLPNHSYNKIKAEHEQMMQAFEQDMNDYSALLGAGMAEIMKGISKIDATEQERVDYVNKGLAKAVVGACLATVGVWIVPAALIAGSTTFAVGALVSMPILLGIGAVGLASMPDEDIDLKAQSRFDIDMETLGAKATSFIEKSMSTVKSLENMRTSERGM